MTSSPGMNRHSGITSIISRIRAGSNREPEHRRVYDYVFDTPPGEQMLIDFGEQALSQAKADPLYLPVAALQPLFMRLCTGP